MSKKYFFGWTNIKWFIEEILNLYSAKPSFFSKKRVESSLAFFAGLWGMVYYMIKNVDKMTTNDTILWSGVLFAMAGYTVNQIQKEKKQTVKEENE